MSETDAKQPEAEQDLDSLSFEEAFERLSETAASLEEGGLTLAEATSRYEQGMVLVRRCNQLLDQTELKITTLKDAHQASHGGGSDADLFEYDEATDGPDDSSEEKLEDTGSSDGSPSLF